MNSIGQVSPFRWVLCLVRPLAALGFVEANGGWGMRKDIDLGGARLRIGVWHETPFRGFRHCASWYDGRRGYVLCGKKWSLGVSWAVPLKGYKGWTKLGRALRGRMNDKLCEGSGK